MEDQPAATVSTPTPEPPKRRFNLAGQLPLLLALVIIAGMLVVWKPWQDQPGANARTITVTGEAEVTAEPDEYVFNPQYLFKNADRKAAQAASTAKINGIVAELKKLGIADSKIKTNLSSYDYGYSVGSDNQTTYQSAVTVTVNDKALAQKVQDYLLTTTPDGGYITPQASFSKAKQRQLTDQGRDEATKDARAKADQSAENLGFKVGKVKAVRDQPNNFFEPYAARTLEMSANGASAAADTTPIQQGEQDLSYTVTVVYYVK